MTIYGDHILPRMIDWAMRGEDFDAYRKRLASKARGRVLEIGVGSGLNLPHYGPEVELVVGLDPSARLLDKAKRAAESAPRPAVFIRAAAEAVPLPDASIDSIMMTWTLCSVSDARASLAEMRRVLKPSGVLLFVEHGLSSEPDVARWQHRIDPLWTRISCHLDNPVGTLLRDAGFAIDHLDTGYMRTWPKTLTYMYEGRAHPAAPD
jgi:ubiquinone/menaquinone biosynthesis C-methylase UbiE